MGIDRYRRERGTLGAWLRGIAINLARQYIEEKASQEAPYGNVDDLAEDIAADDEQETGKTSETEPLCEESQELRRCVREEFDALPEVKQWALSEQLRNGGNGRPWTRDLSKKLHIPPGTLRQHARRALKTIKAGIQRRMRQEKASKQ